MNDTTQNIAKLRGEYDVGFYIGSSSTPAQFKHYEIRVISDNGEVAWNLVRCALSEVRQKGQRHLINTIRFISHSRDPLTTHESAIQLVKDEITAINPQTGKP